MSVDPLSIPTDAEYRRCLAEVESLVAIDPDPASPEGVRLRQLAALIEGYEISRYGFDSPENGNGAAVDDNERVLSLLHRQSTTPPTKGVRRKLTSWLPLMQDHERAELLERLFADGHVHEANASLTYPMSTIAFQ